MPCATSLPRSSNWSRRFRGDTFERLAGEYGVDEAARSFGARDHLMAMLGVALGGFHGACGKPWQGCFPAAARCG